MMPREDATMPLEAVSPAAGTSQAPVMKVNPPNPFPVSSNFTWIRRHLLELEDLEPVELELILDPAVGFAEVNQRRLKKVPVLKGKTVVNLFFEPSTRTKMSFSLAAKRLSAD